MVTHGNEYMNKLNLNEETFQRGDRVANLEKLRDFVRKRLEKASDRSRKQYNLRRRDVRYGVGDVVWKRQYVLSDAANYFTAKLAGKFSGPYKVRKKVGYCVYELEDDQGVSIGNWHTKDLKGNPDSGD